MKKNNRLNGKLTAKPVVEDGVAGIQLVSVPAGDGNDVYAHVGRQAVEIERLNREYDRLAQLFKDVIDGKIGIDRVAINIEARTWAVAPPQPEEVKEKISEN